MGIIIEILILRPLKGGGFIHHGSTLSPMLKGVVKRWRLDLKIGPNKPALPENLRARTLFNALGGYYKGGRDNGK